MFQITQFAQSRVSWALLALTTIGLELTALFFQYGMHLSPCVLCIYQRLAIFGIFFAAIIGMVGHKTIFRYLAIIIWGISAVIGLQLATELVDMQTNPSPFSTCGFLPNFPSFLPLHEWLPSIFMPSGMCTDDVWGLWGLSMAQWMQVVFSLYLVSLVVFIYPIIKVNHKR